MKEKLVNAVLWALVLVLAFFAVVGAYLGWASNFSLLWKVLITFGAVVVGFLAIGAGLLATRDE